MPPDRTENSDSTENSEPQISRVAIKPPPFWKKNPNLWFAQLESQFSLSNITNDTTKFHHVVAAVESEILSSVNDIILNPPATNKYEALKTRLTEIYAESENEKIRKLLQGIELGDQRPSHLLTRMRSLAGTHLSDDILKSMWLSRLPQNVQAILAASKEQLTEMASMADKIIEYASPLQIQHVDATSHSMLQQQIAELTQQVQALSAKFEKNHSRWRSHSRSRYSRAGSKPRSIDRNSGSDICFYHTKFGEEAKKCRPPCSFKPVSN